MFVFLSILQFIFITALVASWAVVTIYLRKLSRKTGKNKAFWLFAYILTSLVVVAIIIVKLSSWKTETIPPPPQQRIINYPINQKSQEFVRRIHAPLADKQQALQQILQIIDSTIESINKMMISHPHNKDFLYQIASYYRQERQQISSVLNTIDIRSQNAMIQATTTQNPQVIEKKFYQQCQIFLAEASATQKHFNKQQAYISSLISDQLKQARHQLSKQQHTTPAILPTDILTFTPKNINMLQHYIEIIDPKLATQLLTITNEVTNAQKKSEILNALIATELDDRPELKLPLEKTQALWLKSGNDAYQRWAQIILALETAHLARQFGMHQNHPAHKNLIHQINNASLQFIREIQASNEKAEQSYFIPQG